MRSTFVTTAIASALCLGLLSACNKDKSSAPEPAPAPATTPTPAVEVTDVSTPTPFLTDETVIESHSRSQFPGKAFTPETGNYSEFGGSICADGKRQEQKIPNATRYIVESKVDGFESGIDGKLWHKHRISLIAMVVKKRISLTDVEVSERRKSLSTEEFANICGHKFIVASYQGALISGVREYKVAAAEYTPVAFKLVVDDNDETNLKQLKAAYDELDAKVEAAKSAIDFEGMGEQSPALLFDRKSKKDVSFFDSVVEFVQLAAKANIPSPRDLPFIEVAPYPTALENTEKK